MKSKKLLIGLIVAAFVGGAHIATAQPKANFQNNLIEIGPDNVAGRIRAIVVDESDPTHSTLYAGGVAGGLFKKVGDTCWQFIPCYLNDRQFTLPISCMVQLPNHNLLIGTGEGFVEEHGILTERMSPRGSGVFVYNAITGHFRQLQSTDPSLYPEWSYVNRLAYMQPEGDTNMYVYAATNEGLYRWKVSAMNPSWSTQPTLVQTGKFMDIVMLPLDNMAYASAEGKLYRIGNVSGQSAAVDITTSNSAFANSSRIELAGTTVYEWDETHGDNRYNTYLYAVVVNNDGLLEGVYLTKDQMNWSKLTTSTTVPFTSENPGTLNVSIAISNASVKSIFVGGATLWQGTGYVANSNYQWIKTSYSEGELNGGNYMGTVYSTPIFLHSGIHQILPTWKLNEDGDTLWTTYYATDGGIYEDYAPGLDPTAIGFGMFRSVNKGLNTVQYNHIAVSPDGSVVGGAIDNSCPFIQSRNAHDGAVTSATWYDDNEGSILNHMGSILWTGNGGDVAASQFQQILPFTRRNLFLSCEPGHFYYNGRDGVTPAASYGRGCTDYADYTNTQTWTTGDGFISNTITTTNFIPKMDLWETTNNTIWNDSITFTIDTNLTYIHNGQVTPLTGSTQIVSGDQILVASKPNFEYPFYYTFNSSFVVKNKMTHTVPNKVVSRMIVTGRHATLGSGMVFLTVTPNYYRNVWSYAESNSATANLMLWGTLFQADAGYSVGDVAFSRDGKNVYIAVSNDSTGKSFLFRIWDYTKANANNPKTMASQIRFQKDNPDYPENPRITHYDTIFAADGNWFNRPITSIVVDPREGQDNVILTFGKYNNGDPNMVYISNAGDPSKRTVTNLSVVNAANGMSETDPVYSAIVECTTGAIFAGTEKGVYTSTSTTNPVWNEFGAFAGVPVTSIVQQTKALPRTTYMAREGVKDVKYLFAKTKYPYAIYFGTYGRGVFMDTTYVTDHVAEISDPEDWNVGITTVDKGDNKISIYPNPAIDNATLELTVVDAGNAVMKIYDINGKLIYSERMGNLNEGLHRYSIDCSKFQHGIYLMNVTIGNYTATSKLIVR